MTLDRDAYRAAVTACRACHLDKRINRWLIQAPRFGLGPTQSPIDFMVIGQNPPADAARCYHGGWLYHYHGPEWDAKKERHEQQMAELLTALGATPANTWVTQAVKCPTERNALPLHGCSQNCQRFLTLEYETLTPRVVLLVGHVAQSTFLELTGFQWFHPEEPDQSPHQMQAGPEQFIEVPTFDGVKIKYYVTRAANVVKIPHVSNAGRFFSLEDLIACTQRAVALAKTKKSVLSKAQLAAWRTTHDL